MTLSRAAAAARLCLGLIAGALLAFSLSFDDFPATAWTEAGPVLAAHGVRATYYVCGGLCDGVNMDRDQYRLEHLQAAHAAFPWVVTWDDHEVDNDYADDRPEDWFVEAYLPRKPTASDRSKVAALFAGEAAAAIVEVWVTEFSGAESSAIWTSLAGFMRRPQADQANRRFDERRFYHS